MWPSKSAGKNLGRRGLAGTKHAIGSTSGKPKPKPALHTTQTEEEAEPIESMAMHMKGPTGATS
jgi:hypothetical protein